MIPRQPLTYLRGTVYVQVALSMIEDALASVLY